jgi:hypothetical protein
LRRALLALVTLGLAALVALGWSGTAKAVATAATSTTLSVTPTAIPLDGQFTMTATVTGSSAPQGTIRFWSGSDLLAEQAVTPVAGSTTQASATVTLTSWFGAGSHPLKASFISAGIIFWGNSESAPATLTVGGATVHQTTTELTVSPSASVTAGQAITLTARVAREDGVTATGTVTFRDGGNLVGTAVLVNGVATLTRSDFPAGAHDLTASYDGPTSDVAASSAAASISIAAPATPTAVDTETTAWSEPETIRAGDTVVLKAHIVQAGTHAAPPGGPVVTFRDVTLAPSTYLGEAPLDADGNASIVVSGWTAGTYVIRADYFGDLLDRPSSGSFSIVVTPAPTGVDTTLAAAPATAPALGTATLAATLSTDGAPVAGETVTLAAGGQTCAAVTDDAGGATCDVPAPASAGSYPITATYEGTHDYNASTASGTLVVTKLSTTLTVPSVAIASGTAATLSATLTTGSAPLAGKPVTLTVGTQHCTATTTAAGLASCTIAFAQAPGSYALTAAFAGDATYAASTGAGTLTATGEPTSLYVFPSIAVYHHRAVLSARLTHDGHSLAGQPVTLTVGDRSCTDTTNFLGVALCTIEVDEEPGRAPIVGTFAGGDGYAPSTDRGTILIAKQPTSLRMASSLVQHSGTVTVSAKLRDDEGDPIAGAPVTLTLGSTTVTATTDDDGVATATFAGRGPGSYAVVARYAGSSTYGGSTAAGGEKLVCYDESRFLVWGGNDRDLDDAVRVGDRVTFWGSQWHKQVRRGDYDGGSSLKGWADHVSGSGWSTGTGNSVSAPGSVADYVSVIVTTHVSKHGSTISGDVARRVVVRVDDADRYDGRPGRSAGGTVVAVL